MKKSLLKRVLFIFPVVLAAMSVVALNNGIAKAQDWDRRDLLRAELSSFNQVPSVLATGHGKFEAEISEDGTISFSLTYSGMSSPVVQAHIHFGDGLTNGGVAVFLCGGAKPACPASGTVTGTITAADVSVLPVTNGDSVIPQGIQPGDLAGLITAIRHGHS
jgi:CHRD domain